MPKKLVVEGSFAVIEFFNAKIGGPKDVGGVECDCVLYRSWNRVFLKRCSTIFVRNTKLCTAKRSGARSLKRYEKRAQVFLFPTMMSTLLVTNQKTNLTSEILRSRSPSSVVRLGLRFLQPLLALTSQVFMKLSPDQELYFPWRSCRVKEPVLRAKENL